MLINGLAVGIIISALLTIRAADVRPRRWYYLFKPLTTTLILLTALASASLGWNPYTFWVVVGLGFSLAGDVFLMLSDKRFIWGLVCFLAAHLGYIMAFTTRAGWRDSLWLSLPFTVVGLVIAVYIASRARGLRWPATVYSLILVAMAWRACAAWAVSGSLPALWAWVGAVLFVISDGALAINHFVRRFRWSQVIVLSTYYAAQALIAWSAWPAAASIP